MVSKYDKPQPIKMGVTGLLVDAMVEDALCKIQKMIPINSFDYVAIVGKKLGELLGAADVAFEEHISATEDDPAREGLKQTFMLNFNVGYNDKRAEYELDRNKKPEPKIV